MNNGVSNRVKRCFIGAGAALSVAALASCSLAGDPGADAAAGGEGATTITVGFLYDVHAANVWTLDQCESDTLNVELSNFKQFAEVQRAFEGDQIDAAAMGYQNMAQMVGNGYEDFHGVAGVYTGGEHITIKAGSGMTEWSDLVGKRVGVPPNSFVEMLFRSSLEEAGVDIADIEMVPFPGAGPPMIAALEKGDIDAMVAWEPNSATAAVQGIGEYPEFDIQQGAIGDATSLMYVSDALLSENEQAVDELVRCMDERTQALNGDVDAWVEALMANTGLDEEVARRAIETGELDINLYQESAEKIIAEFAKHGLLDDSSDRVSEFFDYGPLERVTGKSAIDLGQK